MNYVKYVPNALKTSPNSMSPYNPLVDAIKQLRQSSKELWKKTVQKHGANAKVPFNEGLFSALL